MLLPCLAPAAVFGATLHGRVKDRQCTVLTAVTVRIRPDSGGATRTLTSDDSGNYSVDLSAGNYQLCLQRSPRFAPTCSRLEITGATDVWMTTQLREGAPDLSDLGGLK